MHFQGKSSVLAACDKNLLGKTIEDEDLEFKVSERFYGGEEIDEKAFFEMLNKCTTANLVGEETIALVSKKYKLQKVIYIGGVPHAQIFKIPRKGD